MSDPSDITQLLLAYGDGRRDALDSLIPLVYERLKRLAHARLRHERPDAALNTTGLVHEAYLKLIEINRVQYESRGHFYAVASRVMRRLLVDYARRRRALKRGGGIGREELNEEQLIPDTYADRLLDLDEALHRLEKEHPRAADVVANHYFGGLTQKETAEALGISLSTAERDLLFARAWLSREWSQSTL